jgi:hypothetical protein
MGVAFIGMMVGGPVVGLVVGLTAMALRPRRHFGAAVAAVCIAAVMLLISVVAFLGVG